MLNRFSLIIIPTAVKDVGDDADASKIWAQELVDAFKALVRVDGAPSSPNLLSITVDAANGVGGPRLFEVAELLRAQHLLDIIIVNDGSDPEAASRLVYTCAVRCIFPFFFSPFCV